MSNLIVTTFLTVTGSCRPRAARRGRQRRLRARWLVGELLGRADGQVMDEATSAPFAMVLARRTYEIMAAHRPHAPEEAGAKTWNEATKYVASRSQPTLEWSNSVPIEGDAAEGIAALKKGDGRELQVHGSGNLIQTLMRHNLVDSTACGSSPSSSGRGSACSRTAPSPPG
jgi:dihydrofolate reductase